MGSTLYIFDMGGVVARNTDVFPRILTDLEITQDEFLAFAGEDLGKLFNGKISTAEFWVRFSKRCGRNVGEDLFHKFFHSTLDRKVIALIKNLKDHSRVICGTNTFDPHYHYHSIHGHYDIFDAVFASNKIGLSKPDPAFYRYILKKELFQPENVIFVDDTEANVLSAERIGMNAILFRDSQSLRAQLQNFHTPPKFSSPEHPLDCCHRSRSARHT